MINKRRLIDLFKQLVRIDSLSLKEGKVVKFLRREIRSLGYSSRLAGKPKDGETGSLIVDVPGSGPRILLNAHVDTVAPGKNIKPVEKGGYIHSDGTTVLGADDKTGVAAILEVLRTIKEKRLAHPPLRVIFTVSEEVGLKGAKALPASVLAGDFCITLDHGKPNEIIYKAPAQVSLRATVLGKAAHAGIHPERGINAIKVASEAIAKMKFGRIDKETTSNIGIIQGGKATNIVPDRVEIHGEARSHDPRKLRQQVAHMKKVLEQTCRRRRAGLKLKITRMYESFEVSRSSRPVRLAATAVKQARLKPEFKQTGGGSDANIFNASGVPTIIMGAGMSRVHTTAERVAVRNLLKGAEVLLNLVTGAVDEKA